MIMNMYYVFSRNVKKDQQLRVYARSKGEAMDTAQKHWLRILGDSSRGIDINIHYVGPVDDEGYHLPFDTGCEVLHGYFLIKPVLHIIESPPADKIARWCARIMKDDS